MQRQTLAMRLLKRKVRKLEGCGKVAKFNTSWFLEFPARVIFLLFLSRQRIPSIFYCRTSYIDVACVVLNSMNTLQERISFLLSLFPKQ